MLLWIQMMSREMEQFWFWSVKFALITWQILDHLIYGWDHKSGLPKYLSIFHHSKILRLQKHPRFNWRVQSDSIKVYNLLNLSTRINWNIKLDSNLIESYWVLTPHKLSIKESLNLLELLIKSCVDEIFSCLWMPFILLVVKYRIRRAPD